MKQCYLLLLLLAAMLGARAQTDTASFQVYQNGYNTHFDNTSYVTDTLQKKAFWYFGDGTMAVTQSNYSANHSYAASGTYTVCLRIYRVSPTTQDTIALTASTCRAITVSIAPDSCQAAFDVTHIWGDAPLKRRFRDLPGHNNGRVATSACWTWGDGSSQTCTTPTYGSWNTEHTYAQAGTYNVCLTLSYDGGCQKQACRTIAVMDSTVGMPDSCHSSFYTGAIAYGSRTHDFFVGAWHSRGKIANKICYSFGDGRDTCILYPNGYQATSNNVIQHTYPAYGTYNACVTVFFEGGCQSTNCNNVVVAAPPPPADSCRANFTVQQTGGNTAPFVLALSTQPWHSAQKPVRKVCWNFGDGTFFCDSSNTSTPPALNRTHTYTQNGTYNICVTITYEGGCVSSSCRSVILPAPAQADSCRAAFTVQNGTTARSFWFSAAPWHSQQKPATRVCYTFGDGRDTCVNYPNGYQLQPLPHTYAQHGTYTTCVSITYEGGCVSTYCHNVLVQPDTCSADLSATRLPGTLPLQRHFAFQSSSTGSNAVSSVCWNWGDGTPSPCYSGNNQPGSYSYPHLYNAPGNYNVCVTVSYQGGCQVQKCRLIAVVDSTIVPDSCHADYSWSASSSNRNLASFTALPAHNRQLPATKVCYSFGDGRDTCVQYPNGYNGQVLPHLYAAAGTYNACVIITYQGGCASTACHTVTIAPPPPPPADSCQANFYPAQVAGAPLGRVFSAGPWHNNQKRVTRVCWTFGDGRDTCINYGASAYEFPVTHNYAQYGTYTVCTSISYEGGCVSTACKSVVVLPPPPPPADTTCAVGLEHLTAVNADPLLLAFRAHPLGTRLPLRVQWFFGDGRDTILALPNPATLASLTLAHRYAAYGYYQVCVRMEYEGGCVAQTCVYLPVLPSGGCLAAIHDTLIAASTARFEGYMDLAPGDSVVSWHWNFGDGTSASGRNVTHVYAAGGSYVACLLARTAMGCESRLCRIVTISTPAQTTLALMPNPVSTTLHVAFNSLFAQQVTVRILNVNGLVVHQQTRYAYAGVNTWDQWVSTLPTGYYTFVVQSANQFISKSFFKQ